MTDVHSARLWEGAGRMAGLESVGSGDAQWPGLRTTLLSQHGTWKARRKLRSQLRAGR